MRDALRRLEAAGADYIAIPCNTAHHWHTALQAETAVPILHIVDAVVERLACGESGPIGVLATTGTIKSGIYQTVLSRRGLDWRIPDDCRQGEVMRAIRLVKAGWLPDATAILRAQANGLLSAGCQHVVMACTEIPVALADVDDHLRGSLVDATEALAVASVEAATTRLIQRAQRTSSSGRSSTPTPFGREYRGPKLDPANDEELRLYRTSLARNSSRLRSRKP